MSRGQRRKSCRSTLTPSKLTILTKPINSKRRSASSHEERPLLPGSQTDGAAALIRRNSAKILSFIGWKSSTGSNSPRRSLDCRRSCEVSTNGEDGMRLISGSRPGGESLSNPEAPTLTGLYPRSLAQEDDASSNLVPGLPLATASLMHVEASYRIRKRSYAALRGKSLAQPGRSRQLSRKVSNIFGNSNTPTVVHRTNLRSRPSITTINQPPQQDGTSTQKSTDPSSTYAYSGSVSPLDVATAKTSLDIKSLSSRSSKGKLSSEKSHQRLKAVAEEIKEQPLTPIEEVPVIVTPTVVTIETTANAKIFFETHFNAIFNQGSSPRERRRRDLERRLLDEASTPEQRQKERLLLARHESEHLRQSRVLKSRTNQIVARNGVEVAGFEVVRVLGKGSFGVVRLVRQKTEDHIGPNATAHALTRSGKVYAMKVIRKSDMLRNCQEGHLRAERDFLVASESERSKWIIPLIASFQDTTNLYLVMEYMVGGDFLGLLFRRDILKEKHARWYIAEMVLCVEEAHRLRWIHRDVKPDNFLITASGHLKISDFGLAFDGHWQHDQSYYNNQRLLLMDKLGITVEGDSIDRESGAKIAAGMALANVLTGKKEHEREQPKIAEPTENEPILDWRNRVGKRHLARSVVGTSQYMAPEVIRGHEYDGRCDWWSIGIILYECLYGFTPFVCENRQDTKRKILENKTSLQFPPADPLRGVKVSYEALDLMNSLLQEKEHRLSTKKYAANDLHQYAQQHRPNHHDQHRHRPRSSSHVGTEYRDWKGHYVYSDDAEDIKNHPFFYGVCWERMHLSRPPFIPDIKGYDDTRYFDEEASISDVDDASSEDIEKPLEGPTKGSNQDTPTAANTPRLVDGAAISGSELGLLNAAAPLNLTPGNVSAAAIAATTKDGKDKNKKEKKRPRDRLLRDKKVGRQVLELRKRGAFIGYTYRRADIRGLGLGFGSVSGGSGEDRGRIRARRSGLGSWARGSDGTLGA